MCHSAFRIPYLRRFRIPHGIRTFVLSYLRTPLMREAFQLASRCTLHLGPAVAIANYQSLTPKTDV